MDLNHYTDAGALLGILKNEGINLRATRFSHLNDSREYVWINEKVEPSKEYLCKGFDLTYDPDMRTYPFVVCFCQCPDEHLMWKLYGHEGKGFMLTFDYDKIYEFANNKEVNRYAPDYLEKITYTDDDKWKASFMDRLNELIKEGYVDHSTDIDTVCALMKRDIYKYENEIRYLRCKNDIMEVKSINNNPQFIYDGEDYTQTEFTVSGDGVRPYIDIIFPKEALKSITVGYGFDFDSQKATLNMLLKSRKYENVEIKSSLIKP